LAQLIFIFTPLYRLNLLTDYYEEINENTNITDWKNSGRYLCKKLIVE